jgi:hypothetical protein
MITLKDKAMDELYRWRTFPSRTRSGSTRYIVLRQKPDADIGVREYWLGDRSKRARLFHTQIAAQAVADRLNRIPRA